MELTAADYVVFILYFLATVAFAMVMAWRQKEKSAEGFFMAGHKLPWYVVGASIVAAGVSAEHFIGTVGWAYLYGMAVANWQWAAIVVYSILIWVFLPYYMRGNVSTMPEFLERRYNKACRYMFAFVTIVGMVIALLGGVTFAGAKALNVLFPDLSIPTGIIILGIAAGVYTVYGGLVSGAWADMLQYTVLMVGGITVTCFGLAQVGSIGSLLEALPEKAIMVYGPRHEAIPWTGLITTFLSVGVWYNCANQFIVQRFLGAKSEWDARMGVIMAGFTFVIMPFVIVIPGLIAFHLFQGELSDGDQAWPFLAKRLLPPGLSGLVLAGLAAAIMSTLSAIVHSSATVLTLDLYKPLFRPNASDSETRLVGRIAGTVCICIGIAIAMVLAALPGLTVFGIIQTVFFYVAAPISAIFFAGLLWPRATPAAATATMVLGFASTWLVRSFLFKTPLLAPYDSFTHHTFVVFFISVVLMIVLSLFTKPKPREELVGVIWDKSALRLPESERHLNRGLRNFALWWGVMVAIIAVLYYVTNSRAVGTRWLEAEELRYTVTGGSARIQQRKELQRFNLWTGARQVLLTPERNGATMKFRLPSMPSGRYRLAAVVTQGPEYGRFRVLVNAQEQTITYNRTEAPTRGNTFRLRRVDTDVFDANSASATNATTSSSQAGVSQHVVRRVGLGTVELQDSDNTVTFVVEPGDVSASHVGVDQLIVTKAD